MVTYPRDDLVGIRIVNTGIAKMNNIVEEKHMAHSQQNIYASRFHLSAISPDLSRLHIR